jgi:hypothetical protein
MRILLCRCAALLEEAAQNRAARRVQKGQSCTRTSARVGRWMRSLGVANLHYAGHSSEELVSGSNIGIGHQSHTEQQMDRRSFLSILPAAIVARRAQAQGVVYKIGTVNFRALRPAVMKIFLMRFRNMDMFKGKIYRSILGSVSQRSCRRSRRHLRARMYSSSHAGLPHRFERLWVRLAPFP